MPTPYARGAHRSPPDPRDHPVSRYLAAAPVRLPAQLDLRPYLQAVRDQGAEGTCVAFALASGVLGRAEVAAGQPGMILSPRWLYRAARALQMPPGGAGGAYPRAALQAALLGGVCPESDDPYVAGVDTPPDASATDHARENRVAAYAAVPLDVTAIKTALQAHGPLLAALDTCAGFDEAGAGGTIVRTSDSRGGHGIALVGWDDGREAFLLRDSWGTGWGMQGYGWLPYGYPLWECWAVIETAIVTDAQLAAAPWWQRLLWALESLA